ncbi:LCP family protein [Paenibacillus sp. J2TS4]|uniref:LCP family glycopolymer transferase n=1 Tax=Paenibacillus sp. J2TS4 TaxID=2807194 RepID=UPI001B0FF1DF|nr:LCP family protein [Paenibacillus sp. J2TS4]GIP36165.1 hypothetical protein J2TS4_53750 [Paenibacillus sp. J2TS4]
MSDLNIPARPKRRSLPLYGKILIGLGLAIVSLIVAAGVYANYIIQKANDVIDDVGVKESVPPEQSAKIKPLTIMLMGIDHRKETGSLNTDVIMVVSLNPERKSATVVSIPRDVQLTPDNLPHRKANYYYPHFYLQDKETVFAKTKELFSDYLEVPIDYILTIDFNGFVKAIDELGGLTLDVDMDMCYKDSYDGTDINLKKGTQLLNGKQTLDFVRYRKSSNSCSVRTAESSDVERNMRQQQVLDKMFGKLKSFSGITKVGQLIEAVGEEMKSDIPASQIRDFIEKYYNIDRNNINYVHLEGDWISPYIIVKDEELEEAKAALKAELGLEASVRPSSSPGATPVGTARPSSRPTSTPAPTPKPTSTVTTPKPSPSGKPGSVTEDTYGNKNSSANKGTVGTKETSKVKETSNNGTNSSRETISIKEETSNKETRR